MATIDLKELEAFNADSDNDVILEAVIKRMRFFGKRITKYFVKYCNCKVKITDDATAYFDSVLYNLIQYAEALKDVLSILCNEYYTSLNSLLNSFAIEYSVAGKLDKWLNFLSEYGDDFTSDYFGKGFLHKELYNVLLEYTYCVVDLVDFIEKQARDEELLSTRVVK